MLIRPNGKVTMGFLPGISMKSMKRIISHLADLRVHRWSSLVGHTRQLKTLHLF